MKLAELREKVGSALERFPEVKSFVARSGDAVVVVTERPITEARKREILARLPRRLKSHEFVAEL